MTSLRHFAADATRALGVLLAASVVADYRAHAIAAERDAEKLRREVHRLTRICNTLAAENAVNAAVVGAAEEIVRRIEAEERGAL